MAFRLHFGVPTIDSLLGVVDNSATGRRERFGLFLPLRGTNAPASSCLDILGTEGSGKSILAMHMASAYRADTALAGQNCMVVYASSDLSYARARRAWHADFRLDRPRTREQPFEDGLKGEGAAELISALPRSEVLRRILENPDSANVLFLDLASSTAGDDWAFLNSLVALMPLLGEDAWPHMLVVDAVEGLETMAGDVDSYGLQSSRRSRIAQLLQLATDKCHVILVNEIKRNDEKLAEEYVADAVLRVSSDVRDGYATRTIEVLKARSQRIIRGEHLLAIRGTAPGVRGTEKFPDMPECKNAYLHCFHSLDAKDSDRDPATDKTSGAAPFGVRYLDDMLRAGKDRGVPRGRVIAVIGDVGTHKGNLCRAFLANGFASGATMDFSNDEKTWEVGVYVTSGVWSRDTLAKRLVKHLALPKNTRSDTVSNRIARYLIVRNIEFDTYSSNYFVHLLETILEEAKARVGTSGDRCIRLAIDDFSLLRRMHPVFETDGRLLPYLQGLLRREGVTTVISDSQAGKPHLVHSSAESQPLRSIAHRIIYTWHVPFFGHNTVAINALPSFAEDHQSTIRELRLARSEESPERLVVDPHFEQYIGIDTGEPKRVPLHVHLRAIGTNQENIRGELESLFATEFGQGEERCKLFFVPPRGYEGLRGIANRRSQHRTDETVVLQLDEFWSHRDSTGLFDLSDYLREKVSPPRATAEEVRVADPMRAFEARCGEKSKVERRQCYDDPRSMAGHPLCANNGGIADWEQSDRTRCVPYSWDAGFLLLDRRAWAEAAMEGEGGADGHRSQLVRKVSDAISPKGTETCSWRQFLRACQFVSRRVYSTLSDEVPPAFDLDMNASESINCLFLEVWASEIALSQGTNKLGRKLAKKPLTPSGLPSLLKWVKDYRFELYLTFLLLSEVLEAGKVREPLDPFEFQVRGAASKAVASRHWYSSACEFFSDHPGAAFEVARLPGSYTCRGDWFLGVARGSRSRRLGERAIDLLSSRRANAFRLSHGIGLPTRKLHAADPLSSYTRTAIPWSTESGVDLMFYEEFVKRSGLGTDSGLRYLWRSNLLGYHRHARVLTKWIGTTLGWFGQTKEKRSGDWDNGFKLYDRFRLFSEDFRASLTGVRPTKPKTRCAKLKKRFECAQLEWGDRELHAKERKAAVSDACKSSDGLVELWRNYRDHYGTLDTFGDFGRRCDFLVKELEAATSQATQ